MLEDRVVVALLDMRGQEDDRLCQRETSAGGVLWEVQVE